LQDTAPAVRLRAAEQLGSIGRQLKGALPRLHALLKDKDPGVRIAAAAAVASITDRPEAVVSLLRDLLHDENERVRTYAVSAVSSVPDAFKPAMPRLVELLRSESLRERIVVAVALRKIGRPASQAVPALIKAANEAGQMFAFRYASALVSIADRYDVAGPIFLEALQADGDLPVDAARELWLMGEVATPIVQKALVDGSSKARARAARIAGRMGRRASSAIPALEQALHDEELEVRKAAQEALNRIRAEHGKDGGSDGSRSEQRE
jgi:HEAT repeat protein